MYAAYAKEDGRHPAELLRAASDYLIDKAPVSKCFRDREQSGGLQHLR